MSETRAAQARWWTRRSARGAWRRPRRGACRTSTSWSWRLGWCWTRGARARSRACSTRPARPTARRRSGTTRAPTRCALVLLTRPAPADPAPGLGAGRAPAQLALRAQLRDADVARCGHQRGARLCVRQCKGCFGVPGAWPGAGRAAGACTRTCSLRPARNCKPQRSRVTRAPARYTVNFSSKTQVLLWVCPAGSLM